MSADALSHFRHDYHAKHYSGYRRLDAIKFGIVHDGEAPNAHTAAEGMGSWFENPASGGSAWAGVDNDTTQIYLPLTAIAWGAPPLNVSGVHIEQAGVAALHRHDWLKKYDAQLDRLAFLIARLNRRLGLPITHLSNDQLRRAGVYPHERQGWVLHSQVSAVFHQSTHTDPGAGYPIDIVIERAREFRRGMHR